MTDTSIYSVSYQETDKTTEKQHNALTYLIEWSGTLSEIIEVCKEYNCEAILYDGPGFAKGWVHSDGSYTLN